MKNLFIVLIFTAFIGESQLKAQDKVNVVLSFRPTIGASASKNQPDDIAPGLSYNVNKQKSNNLNFNLSIEIPTKKGFYHFPVVGFDYLNYVRKSENLKDDIVIRKNKDILNRTNIRLGYGLGKYIYIYKESVFLNFKNSLAFNYGIGYSKDNFLSINDLGQDYIKRVNTSTQPDTYGLIYELNPSLGYRLKNFSLSLGLPLDFGLNVVDGKQKSSTITTNLITGEIEKNESASKSSSTSFAFSYALELGLRYHIPYKKKE